MSLLRQPAREYLIAIFVTAALAADFLEPSLQLVLFAVALLGSLPTAFGALRSFSKGKINIDVFNVFALIISFAMGGFRSAAFIVLMLTFARILDWRTASRAHRAVEELLKLKPERALRERGQKIEEIDSNEVGVGDILVAEQGSRIPVDGAIVFGEAFVNEAPVTGESVPIRKIKGDLVVGGTLVVSGALKFKAERVGKDSTLERMAGLMREAAKNKSRAEKMADRFAAIFLPIVAAMGIAVYFLTHNILMTAALFLVACADDMAVAIPLAIMAALGRAAKRGVVMKGGEWLEVLGKMKTLVLDKTGTLTYGAFVVRNIYLHPGISPGRFWLLLGIAEKFSEHPAGRAVYREAENKISKIPDPGKIRIYKGSGVWAKYGRDEVAVGNKNMAKILRISVPADAVKELKRESNEFSSAPFSFLSIRNLPGLCQLPTCRERARKKVWLP
jgi:cation transport ATPase